MAGIAAGGGLKGRQRLRSGAKNRTGMGGVRAETDYGAIIDRLKGGPCGAVYGVIMTDTVSPFHYRLRSVVRCN